MFMDKTITYQEKERLASIYNIELSTLLSVVSVESAGSGFDIHNEGKIKIQFEPTIFSKQLNKRGIPHSLKVIYTVNPSGKKIQEYEIICNGVTLTNGVEGQVSEYKALELAKKIHIEAALLSTSWGLGQIMGFNYKVAGYSSVEEMVDSFLKGEYNQLNGMLTFIKNSGSMLSKLQDKDWSGFAELYNGPEYKKFNYDVRLKEANNKLK